MLKVLFTYTDLRIIVYTVLDYLEQKWVLIISLIIIITTSTIVSHAQDGTRTESSAIFIVSSRSIWSKYDTTIP